MNSTKANEGKGFIFFANLKQLKVCRDEIEKSANALLSNGRLLAIPWSGRNAVLVQPSKTLSGVYSFAEQAREVYVDTVTAALAAADVDVGVFTCCGLKSKQRAREKAENEYDSRFERLVDVVRGMCVFTTEEELVDFFTALSNNGNIKLLRVKNRFNPPNFNGYRDLLLNISVPVGSENFICELQIHLQQIKESDALYKSHQAYEFFRAYFMGNADAVQKRLEMVLLLPVNDVKTVGELVNKVMADPDSYNLDGVILLLEWMHELRHTERIRRFLCDKAAKRSKETGDYAARLADLALACDRQGKYSEAEPMYNEALDICRRLYGNDHPSVIMGLNRLAALNCAQADFYLSEPLYMEALQIRKRLLDDGDPKIAESLSNLANVYSEQGKYAKAEPMLREAMSIIKDALGEESLTYADSLKKLACLHSAQGEYNEAEPLFREALAMQKRLNGDSCHEVACSLEDIATLYKCKGAFDRSGLSNVQGGHGHAAEAVWATSSQHCPGPLLLRRVVWKAAKVRRGSREAPGRARVS